MPFFGQGFGYKTYPKKDTARVSSHVISGTWVGELAVIHITKFIFSMAREWVGTRSTPSSFFISAWVHVKVVIEGWVANRPDLHGFAVEYILPGQERFCIF